MAVGLWFSLLGVNVYVWCWTACSGQDAGAGQVGLPVLDVEKFSADHPQPATLPPTWRPPDGETYDNFVGRYGMKTEDYEEMKALVADLMIAAGVAPSDAHNNNGRIDDTVLMSKQLRSLLKPPQQRHRRAVSLNFEQIYPTYKWPTDSTIKYKFAGQHTDFQEELIRQAFQFWEENTCLTFEEVSKDPTEQFILITADSIGCYSTVGRKPEEQGIPQILNLRLDSCVEEGIIMHEIEHTLGLRHEQSRPDRDSYVSINLKNIPPGLRANLAKHSSTTVDTLDTPYDYNSVMHYPSKMISQSIRTITPIGTSGTKGQNNTMHLYGIGQRTYPSFWDIRGVNNIYCSAACSLVGPVCQNNGYVDPIDCSRCRCAEGLGGALCDTVATGGAACSPSSHAVLDVSTDGSERCVASPGFSAKVQHPQGKGTHCNFLIKAPAACSIDSKFTYGPDTLVKSKGGCIHWVELKYQADLSLPGPRFCANYSPTKALGLEWLTSESNRMVVIFNAEAPYLSGSSLPEEGSQGKGFELCYKLTDPLCLIPCQLNQCGPHGICASARTGYRCICTSGFTGTHCERSAAVRSRFLHPWFFLLIIFYSSVEQTALH